MKNQSFNFYVFLFAAVFSFLSCEQKPVANNNAAATGYFANTDTGVQSGGVKMISISTPKGKFNVWTKRFGNNPTIKLLLLNGGPGATH